VEGNRGLFDGMDAEGSYSTSRVARIIKSPVILIVDCTKSTRTIAAILSGVKRFERGLTIGGVVLNRVAGERHKAILKESIEKYAGLPVIGAIPKLRSTDMVERHMGLTPTEEHKGSKKAVRQAAAVIKRHVDLNAVMRIARSAPPLKVGGRGSPSEKKPLLYDAVKVKIGVIKDSAFQFYYPENLEALRNRGAEIVEFSALKAKRLPVIDALYIGGGFPETHAISLSKNTPLKKSLRRAVEAGLPVYAECGGLMYLGESLLLGGKRYRMAGVLPVSFSLHPKPQAHGYTIVKVTKKNPFYKYGTVLRGHEFHYSRIENSQHLVTSIKKGAVSSLSFKMLRGEGINGKRDGLCYRNVFATYTHLHALGSPEWADGIIRVAEGIKNTYLNV
jgi:cobyrinic acid a,c-diamide synthase